MANEIDKIPGLKVGLEIHQQVGRPEDHKLFCRCPAVMIERQPDLTLTRKLHASAGETGVVDLAAAAEAMKGKQYVYHAFSDGTCLVELDEEPPHPVNEEVVKTAVMVAKACRSLILPSVQFMRKTIVDGSATSGFQRTGLFAMGGIVPETTPQVRLQTICIEEDAAKIVTRTPDEDTYNLSRLGIPLIEIATEPDITSPQQAQEVAAQIGMILRSTHRVKRGLGTIRQDLNVSIPGGTRVEIKGSQDLRMIPTVIEYEALRQKNLLAIKDKLGASKHTIDTSLIDLTAAFQHSSVSFIKSAIAKGDGAFGIRTHGWKGIFGTELMPNYRVGSELADLARARGFGGLIHSDEDMKKYGIALDAISHHIGEEFIILIGKKEKIEAAFRESIIPRLEQFKHGVPKEVRKANPDGTTSFLRPMPGAARMYPETDVPIVHVKTDGIHAPKLFTEQVRELMDLAKIAEDPAKQIVREGIPLLEYMKRYPSIESTFLANATLNFGKEILSRYKKEIDHIALLEPLFDAVERKQIPKSAVFEILVEIAEGKTTLEKIDYSRYAHISEHELRKIIREAIMALPNANPNVIMGKVMAQVRGKAEGKRIMELIEEEKKGLL